MGVSLPICFKRDSVTKIQARGGWIFIRPVEGTNRYYVTASGEKAKVIDDWEISGYVRELVKDRDGLMRWWTVPLKNEAILTKVSKIVKELMEADEEDKKEDPAKRKEVRDTILKLRDKLPDFKRVLLVARRWRHRTYGNTYHSVSIYLDGRFVHKISFSYGYGDQFKITAAVWLIENGYLGLVKPGQFCLTTLSEKGIELDYDVVDVARRSDL